MREYYVYVMAGTSRTIYTGMTNDLQRRVSEHKLGRLLRLYQQISSESIGHYEATNDVHVAIAEKEIKGWRREKKLR
ncbi:MAG: GIY-YIG nuclease family protein [Caldilineaceae bacterium]